MPPRLPDTTRDAILGEIRAGELSCRAIAKKHGVSAATVSSIGKTVDGAFERTQTKNATAAVVADNAAVRAATSRRFLDKANWFMDLMDQPYTVFAFGGKDNVYREHTLQRPPIPELRNLMVSAATAFDKHLRADQYDADDEHGISAVDEWLRSIVGS